MNQHLSFLHREAIAAVRAAGCTGWPSDPGWLHPTRAAMSMYERWLDQDAAHATDPKQRALYAIASDRVRDLRLAL